jgi:hypothetical protein
MSTISAIEAKSLAIAHVKLLDLRGWRYECAGISENSTPTHWAAVFDVFSPEGNLVDGPVIFLIEKKNGTVTALEAE